MLKILVFTFLVVSFAAFSAAAQTKVDRYVGTWKMVSQPKGSKLKMIALNASVADEMFKVERTTEYVVNGKAHSSTVIYSYKLNGGTSTSLPFQGVSASTYLRYLADGKLQLGYDWNSTNASQDPLAFNTSVREYWSLSGDGRTLTVGSRKYFDSSNFVFAKQ